MKREFECEGTEDKETLYTTEDCGVCVCFWDCVTGLQESLQDEDFAEEHEEIRKRLEELDGENDEL